MALLQVNNLYMGFSGETLFKNITFSVNDHDKIGLIGINGAGKTTLIKILLGIEEDDIDPSTNKKGTISKASGIKIGYLSQDPILDPNNTVFEELMTVFDNVKKDYHRILELNVILGEKLGDTKQALEELGEVTTRYENNQGYSIEYKVKQVLNGLGIEESIWKQLVNTLSGGQLSRVALGKVLLEEPDLIILDEPTNHLDLSAIEWLEKYLKEYKKSIILISHDVYFLDNVVNRVFELERKTIKTYSGNYTDFVIQKDAYITGAVKAYDKEQDKIKKTEEYIRRYKAGIKSKQARGREKILNRMEKMDDPVFTPRKIKLKFKIKNPSVDLVLRIKNLSKSFDGKKLFSNINLDVYRGDRIGIIGKNGVGKSTILKIITGKERQSSGDFLIGEKVKIGYFDQNHLGLDLKSSILDELRYTYDLSEEQARNIAGGFLFSDDDVKKIIGSLSGGEKARVSLMKIMLEDPNFLIFDEPTNHLDIYSREILMEALEDYQGTVLVVSHDRNFLDNIVTKIYEIKKDGAMLFDGDYNAYLDQRDEIKIDGKKEEKIISYEEQKKLNNQKNILERTLQKIEKEVDKLERSKSKKEEEYTTAGKENDLDKLMELQAQIDETDKNIIKLMEEWEDIENKLSNFNNS